MKTVYYTLVIVSSALWRRGYTNINVQIDIDIHIRDEYVIDYLRIAILLKVMVSFIILKLILCFINNSCGNRLR